MKVGSASAVPWKPCRRVLGLTARYLLTGNLGKDDERALHAILSAFVLGLIAEVIGVMMTAYGNSKLVLFDLDIDPRQLFPAFILAVLVSGGLGGMRGVHLEWRSGHPLVNVMRLTSILFLLGLFSLRAGQELDQTKFERPSIVDSNDPRSELYVLDTWGTLHELR